MSHDFDLRHAAEVHATPDQVWEAIATGPGIDSWFMGRTEVEPGRGGVVRTAFGGYAPEHTVTAWAPSERIAYRTDESDDGRFVAYEFLIEGRADGTTLVRVVTNGFLPGDDWEDEFDAMTKGTALFFRTLVEYLDHFAGRTATPVTAFGPPVTHWADAWTTLRDELGLSHPVTTGDPVRCTPEGLDPIVGVVYAVNPQTLGIRTDDALYRFLQGFNGPMIASHNLFSDVEPSAVERAWESWLTQCFAPA